MGMAVPLRDTEKDDLLDYLEVCIDFIDRGRKEGSVLVHCFAGVSRRFYLKLSWIFLFYFIVVVVAVFFPSVEGFACV